MGNRNTGLIRFFWGAAALLLVPPFLSGPIRAATGCSISFGLAAGAAVGAAIVAAVFLRPNLPPLGTSLCFAAVALIAAVRLLYHRAFGGLVALSGGDGGGHVYYTASFPRSDAGAYNGMVSYFSSAYWLETVAGLNAFESLRALFYLTLLIVLLAIALAQQSGSAPHAKVRLMLLSCTALLLYLPAIRIILPILHYLQADGFYPQFFGAVPLFAVWAALGYSNSLFSRLLVLAAGTAAYRFTYGLNLGDFLFGAAGVLLLEKQRGKRLIAVIPAGAGMYAYSKLQPLFSMKGGITPPEVPYAVAGTILLSLLLLAAVRFDRLLSATAFSAGFKQLLCFSGVFGLASALAQCAYAFAALPQEYYWNKYNFHPALLVTGAAVVLSTAIAVNAFGKFRSQARSGHLALAAAAIVAAAGLKIAAIGYAPYRASFDERARGAIANSIIGPVIYPETDRQIRTLLSSNGKQFGGLILPSWPVSNFMNAMLGYHRGIELWQTGSVSREPGRCAFWFADDLSLEQLRAVGGGKAFAAVERLQQRGSNAVTYQDFKGVTRSLRYACND